MMEEPTPPTLLCTANFPAGTGYAWDFIESLYAGVADRLAKRGIRTLVAYPGLERMPRPLEGSAAEPVDRDFRVGGGGATRRAAGFVREVGATVLYMADRPAWHPGYASLRRAGVRGIVVHDHTSGSRTRPSGLRRALKRARLQLLPAGLADRVIAVSDFVARRKVEVDLVPPERVLRIWNSIALDEDVPGGAERAIREELGVADDRPIVLCVGRASPRKGVNHLLRAFEALLAGSDGTGPRPVLVYAGEGPALEELTALRDSLGHPADIHLLGYRTDVPSLMAAADLAVVPSVWAEAFGLAALEPMVRGRAVVATDVGGLPEVVVDGATGLLVPPGDERALAGAISRLLADDAERERMGRAGRRRAEEHFGREAQLDRLSAAILACFPARGPEA